MCGGITHLKFLAGKRVLVTGADGFIGSHLVEALVREGCQVRAFVLYNSFNSRGWLEHSPKEVLGSIEVFSGDVRDPHGVRAAMKDCQVVMHLAALIAIPYSYHSPDAYVDTNVKGTLNVLQAARESGVEKLLHTSTSEVYGTARTVPINENHVLQGQSPYSATKIGADHLALSFHASFATPVVVVRPFNTYGPRQSARAVIPTVITQLAGGQEEIKIGALHPTRDFNYVVDTVRGFVAIANADNIAGEVINLGSNFEVSIGDTIRLIGEIMGRQVGLKQETERFRPAASEVDRLRADNSKALSLTSWRPEYGGLDGFRRGLEETVTWFSNPSNLALYRAEVYNI